MGRQSSRQDLERRFFEDAFNMLGSNVIENFRWIRFRGGRFATAASRNLKARSKFHKLLSP